LELLVDSGATYTVLPLTVWKALGIEPNGRRVTFRLADGTTLKRQMGSAVVQLGDEPALTTPVVLGGEGDLPLLGCVTLEEAGLMLDPLRRRLIPMRILLPTRVGAEVSDEDE
jgi:predicted aspartyl protease